MSAVVIANESLGGARAAVPVESLPDWEARGWALIGPCSEPSRAPLLTDPEQAAADAALTARLATAVAPQDPAAATAPARPRKTTKEQ